MSKLTRCGIVLITAGAFCVLLALGLFLYNMWDDARAGIQVAEEKDALIAAVLPGTDSLHARAAELRSASAQPSPHGTDTPQTRPFREPEEGPTEEGPEPDGPPSPGEPDAENPSAGDPAQTEKSRAEAEPRENPQDPAEMEVKEVNAIRYVAILSIPSLKLELPVRSEFSYENLRYAPCRYTGSALRNDLVICAHNYSCHFGQLKDLKPGSEVLLVDMNGELYRYEVELIETVGPMEIEKMVFSGYDLSLFTCTLDGRTRVTVRCRRVNE